MSNAKDRGPKITGDDVVLATINLNTPADPASRSIDLSGSTTLSPEGAKSSSRMTLLHRLIQRATPLLSTAAAHRPLDPTLMATAAMETKT
ncbi:hypothetical protein CIP107528_00657 [Corynebacterium diphtheriae]|nr:HtaA domain-containing protein [Corynebacterium diphtheriae]KLN41606.1 hypothetical protein AL07_03055 [Corynebacterium diphtheriae bv. gravis str. ISS 4060]CAB0540999.1 hypothetical protein CIP107525_00572 [Corynebacterium diphtheriae]CAB0542359.1 hypothetical protein CIP107528_00657 [Corynebacterium diphtheriae]